MAHWVSGRTTNITSGGSLSFNKIGSGSATINASNGQANVGSKGTTSSSQTTVATVTLTVSMNGKSDTSGQANVYQGANGIDRTSWGSWSVTVSADKTNFPREGGSTTVRGSASRSGTHPLARILLDTRIDPLIDADISNILES